MHRHSLVPILLLLLTSFATTVVAVAVDVDTCESSDHEETCVAPVEETDLANWKPVCAKEVVIPDGVTSIRSAAFAMCSSLASIVIPDSVTTIEKRAFYACTSLTSIVIPISVTTIEMSAFYECTSLTAFVVPDSVTSIGAMAFQRCTSLISIVIPDSVMAIEARAFSLCSSLTTASIPSGSTLGDNVFFNSPTNVTTRPSSTPAKAKKTTKTAKTKKKKKEQAAAVLSRRNNGKATRAEVLARRDAANCNDVAPQTQCIPWAMRGECKVAPGWMTVHCAASCDACELLDPAVRCSREALNTTASGPAFKNGDLDALFEGLEAKWPQYRVEVLSQPPAGPWIVKLHDFVQEEEIEALLELAGDFKRSTDQGSAMDANVVEQVVSTSRTSENAWCDPKCEADPRVQRVTRRISAVTGVDPGNFESFQVLHYAKGQFYKEHHDMNPTSLDMPSGARVLTMFLYLNDAKGGGTDFPRAGVTAQPTKGSAILWPSLLSDDVEKLHPLTYHAALPVDEGHKFAANHWIHQYNYKVPSLWGCTGSFS